MTNFKFFVIIVLITQLLGLCYVSNRVDEIAKLQGIDVTKWPKGPIDIRKMNP